MVSPFLHGLRAAPLACSLIAAAALTSRLVAQGGGRAPPQIKEALNVIVSDAGNGFSSFIVGDGKVTESGDTVWTVTSFGKPTDCRVWGRTRGSRTYACPVLKAVGHAEARTVHDDVARQIREALGSAWTFEERQSEESLIRRRLTATRPDGAVEVELTLWQFTDHSNVDLDVTTPARVRAPRAAAPPADVARETAPGSPPEPRTEFQMSLLEVIMEGEEDGFAFLAGDEGEVMDGDTIYQALPAFDADWCDVWGMSDGSREYACVMTHSEKAPEVASRYDALAGEIREVLGSAWTFHEERNGDRTLTATRNDGTRVRLWLSNRPNDVNLELTVGAP